MRFTLGHAAERTLAFMAAMDNGMGFEGRMEVTFDSIRRGALPTTRAADARRELGERHAHRPRSPRRCPWSTALGAVYRTRGRGAMAGGPSRADSGNLGPVTAEEVKNIESGAATPSKRKGR